MFSLIEIVPDFNSKSINLKNKSIYKSDCVSNLEQEWKIIEHDNLHNYI